jgi:1-acyl-sn-glycerol-3-phosphate acyltransferase
MSTMETFCIPGILATHKPIAFVLKRSLTTYPIFNRVVNAIEPIAVDRVNAREDFKTVMEEGQERLSRGISVIVFPQTTRTPNLDRTAFNSIGIKLAKKAGVPVIPLALRTDAWGVGSLLKDYGYIRPELPVRFCFGEPVAIRGAGKNEQEEIMEFIHWKLKAWRTE